MDAPEIQKMSTFFVKKKRDLVIEKKIIVLTCRSPNNAANIETFRVLASHEEVHIHTCILRDA